MRRTFFSFDWENDVWRVNPVRNSWVTKGGSKKAGFADAADIERLKRSTSAEIKRWIDDQLKGTSVTCVLIGEQTADRYWVNYEIQESIERRNGLLGVYIHNVKDKHGYTCYKGASPFNGLPDYPYHYDWIVDRGYINMGSWIERAAKQAGR